MSFVHVSKLQRTLKASIIPSFKRNQAVMVVERAKNIKFDGLDAREKKINFDFQNLEGGKPFLNIEVLLNGHRKLSKPINLINYSF